MKYYVTKSGDMWDSIAHSELGDCKYVDKLIDANRDKAEIFIFSAGVKLKIPDVEKTMKVDLPAWRN